MLKIFYDFTSNTEPSFCTNKYDAVFFFSYKSHTFGAPVNVLLHEKPSFLNLHFGQRSNSEHQLRDNIPAEIKTNKQTNF